MLKDRVTFLMLVLAAILGSFIGLIMFIQAAVGRDDYKVLIKMSKQSYFVGCYRQSDRTAASIPTCKSLSENYGKEIEIE